MFKKLDGVWDGLIWHKIGRWHAFVNAVKSLQFLQNAGDFSTV
jgi:uncharacterized membrane protein